ncbi:MAG: hypothetical protein H0S85_01360 [Desulfovibrionaceae bacterium]|jgi:predicted nucleic acid-binding protein|nr:hypothetical protein [Desulfovibrionaceae bacterium]
MVRENSGFILGSILAVAASLVLGLTLVWLNIERMDMAYGLKQLQTEIDKGEALSAKLGVERDNLMSPYRLRRKAEEYGLAPAGQGQVRRMPDPDARPGAQAGGGN